MKNNEEVKEKKVKKEKKTKKSFFNKKEIKDTTTKVEKKAKKFVKEIKKFISNMKAMDWIFLLTALTVSTTTVTKLLGVEGTVFIEAYEKTIKRLKELGFWKAICLILLILWGSNRAIKFVNRYKVLNKKADKKATNAKDMKDTENIEDAVIIQDDIINEENDETETVRHPPPEGGRLAALAAPVPFNYRLNSSASCDGRGLRVGEEHAARRPARLRGDRC